MDYELYIARVVDVAINDNRLQVKILPQMENIENADCPIWSYFFKDEALLANPGDYVWVICDKEFSSGYILGMANYTTYREESFEKYSLPKKLKESISNTLVDLKASSFSFTNLKVLYWNNNCIHFIERSTGGLIIAYQIGTLYIFRPDEFQIKIGDSFLKINADDISFAGKSIKLQSKDVELGNNPAKSVLTTFGVQSNTAVPSEYVKA